MHIFRNIVVGAVMIAAPLSMARAADSNDGYNRDIIVYNESDYQVYRVYYGVPGQEYYTRDLLYDEVINPGDSIVITPDNGRGTCTYKLKAVTQSNETYWERTMDVCRGSEWTLTN